MIRDKFIEQKQRRIQLFHKDILVKGTHIYDSHIEATILKEIHVNDLVINCKIKKVKGENKILQDELAKKRAIKNITKHLCTVQQKLDNTIHNSSTNLATTNAKIAMCKRDIDLNLEQTQHLESCHSEELKQMIQSRAEIEYNHTESLRLILKSQVEQTHQLKLRYTGEVEKIKSYHNKEIESKSEETLQLKISNAQELQSKLKETQQLTCMHTHEIKKMRKESREKSQKFKSILNIGRKNHLFLSMMQKKYVSRQNLQ